MADKAKHQMVNNGSAKITTGQDREGNTVQYISQPKKCSVCGCTAIEKSTKIIPNAKQQFVANNNAKGIPALEKPNVGKPVALPYAGGGVNDYTGLAMLHGTPSKPEGILNAEDYKAWKQDIKTTNLLYNALATVSTAQRNAAAAANSIGSQNAGVNIENAVVNMNTTIANDYDARRAGEQALEQMLTIARKSGTRSAQRR